jgi:hypothetical protein
MRLDDAWPRCGTIPRGRGGTIVTDARQLHLRKPTTARPPNDSPPSYRVKYDGVEVGSISETSNHITSLTYWRWGVDTMPLLDHGGRPPSGQTLTLADAQAAFREAFLNWLDGLKPGEWERNRDYKKR